MLTPVFLTDFPEPIFKLYQELEDTILADISRRIAKAGKITDTAKWQIERLKAIGVTDEAIKNHIADTNKIARTKLEDMLNGAAQTSYNAESSIYTTARKNPGKLNSHPELQLLIKSIIKQSKGELKNLTRSLGIVELVNGKGKAVDLTKAYQKQLDLAQLSISTGTLDYNTAIRTAVKRLADSGIRFVDYDSGTSNHLDVAARRAVMTGVNQMSVQMTDVLADKLDCEYFEVTAHAGARPNHALWQGKVYHRGGAKNGYQDLESVTGLGSVEGLCGANCRHSYNPFFPGISVRAYSDHTLRNIDPTPFVYHNRVYTAYEATQQQRAMETEMRKTKRQLNCFDAAGLKDDYTAAAVKLKRQQDAYAEFSKASNLFKQKDRAQVYGFGHSQASKAVWANKKVKSFGDFSGIELKNGITIKGASDHFGQQALSRNISKTDIHHALTSPLDFGKLRTDSRGKSSLKIIGEKATVVINPDDGTLVTVYATSTNKAEKLKRGMGNEKPEK